MAGVQFPNGIESKPASGMAWAVDAATRAPVYIGKLTRAQTGLRCGCVCPACDAQLQAVNAGADANRRRVPFFRHHVGNQGPGCKYRVAELAALRLFAEKGVIEIPAPRKQAVRLGTSGTLYQAEAVGTAVRERIVERRLISEASAVLTLESGRKVALVLRGHQDVGELGSVFAVIQVHVEDPEVAWLSPEEIMRRSELSAEWLHVVTHEEDRALQAQADEAAIQKALDQLDVDPEALGLPIGATRKQASESLIHWAVKEALLNLGWLQAPELRLTASAVGNAGQAHTAPVYLPSVRLVITEVTAEVLFDGYRPDIVCEAREPSDLSGRTWRLLVEVAVNNKVKPEKLRLIQAADVACIELDVMGFAGGGAVTLPQLRDLVASDIASKSWLHHPDAAGHMADAQARANAARNLDDARHAAAKAREAEQRKVLEERERQEEDRAEAKLAWARSLDREGALRELRGLLTEQWAGAQQYTSNGMGWYTGEFDRAIQGVLPRAETISRQLATGGIVSSLEAILRSDKSPRRPLDVKVILALDATYMSPDVRQWLGLLHMTIVKRSALIVKDQAAYQEQRRRVRESLLAGESTYARPTELDDVLASMFPELREVLSEEFGTRAYGDRVRQEKADRLRDAQQRAEEERKRQAAEDAVEQERRQLRDAIDKATYQWTWKPASKLPKSATAAVDYLNFSKHKDCGEHLRALVRDAFGALRHGQDFAPWFALKDFTSPEQVTQACEVLEAAWLVQNKVSR